MGRNISPTCFIEYCLLLGSWSQLFCLLSDILSEPHQAFFQRDWLFLSHGTRHRVSVPRRGRFSKTKNGGLICRQPGSSARSAIPQHQSLRYETKNHFSYRQNIAEQYDSRHTNFHIRKISTPAPRRRPPLPVLRHLGFGMPTREKS